MLEDPIVVMDIGLSVWASVLTRITSQRVQIISHDHTSHLDIVIAVKRTASAQLPVTCSTVKHTVTPLVWLRILQATGSWVRA